MCIHPEALHRVKNFIPTRGSKYHDVHDEPHDTPSQAQWMIRQTNYESTNFEKFDLLVD